MTVVLLHDLVMTLHHVLHAYYNILVIVRLSVNCESPSESESSEIFERDFTVSFVSREGGVDQPRLKNLQSADHSVAH